MNKKLLTTLTAIAFSLGMNASYADIWVGSHSGNYKPRTVWYDATIENVSIGYSHTQDSSGKILSRKHNYVYVQTKNQYGENLSFDFSNDDLQNGLALMSAIGKRISVDLELDNDNKLIVKNIIVR